MFSVSIHKKNIFVDCNFGPYLRIYLWNFAFLILGMIIISLPSKQMCVTMALQCSIITQLDIKL